MSDDTHDDGSIGNTLHGGFTEGPEIVVTPEMVKAGVQDYGEFSRAEDIGYVLESVYRAMEYARRAVPPASVPSNVRHAEDD